MAINKFLMDWMLELEQNFKILSQSQSIADLGPQDLSPDLKILLNSEHVDMAESRDLYSYWGIKNYMSFDLFDRRSEKVDLNLDLERTDSWDVVTNFGTSEHLFNQFAFMKNCHDLTRQGGVSLHVLPVSSGMDHGFFNYHPTFFRSLAIANNYEILDFRFIPFIVKQHESGKESCSFVSLGKSRRSTERKEIFMSKVKLLAHISNLRLLLSSSDFHHNFFLGDYIFVAFRKNSSNKFVTPIQERYNPSY
jgi:hypothetical protein